MASKDEASMAVMSALEQCLTVQAEHLTAMQAGSLTQIDTWIEDRQFIVCRMRQALAEAQKKGVTPENRDIILKKLECILEREKALSKIAEQQRLALEKNISSLRRGKKALNGYGPTLAPAPHFVSHKQ